MRVSYSLIVLLALFGLQCSKSTELTNNAPRIASLTAYPSAILTVERCALVCVADDPDGDNLTYSWEPSSGVIEGSGDSVTWVPPDSEAVFTVKCGVADGRGSTASSQVSVSVSRHPVPIDGLIAYYPFSGNANDESGNGYHGTVNGAALRTDRFGAVGSAYEFNGGGSNIVSSPALPVGNSARSVSLWFNTTSSSGSNGWYVNTAVSWGSPSPNSLCAVQVYMSILMFGAFGTAYDVSTGLTVNDGKWHHAVVTYNGSVVSVYLDNSLVATAARNLTTASSALYVGTRAGQSNQYMNGLVDDIRIYDHELTTLDVRTLFRENGSSN